MQRRSGTTALIFLLSVIFYVVSREPAGDRYVKYEGMDKKTITALEKERGRDFEFTSEKAYKTHLASQKRVVSESQKSIDRP